MQLMQMPSAMLEQTAQRTQVVEPQAAKMARAGRGAEDHFSPALQKASDEIDRKDDLAGAATVADSGAKDVVEHQCKQATADVDGEAVATKTDDIDNVAEDVPAEPQMAKLAAASISTAVESAGVDLPGAIVDLQGAAIDLTDMLPQSAEAVEQFVQLNGTPDVSAAQVMSAKQIVSEEVATVVMEQVVTVDADVATIDELVAVPQMVVTDSSQIKQNRHKLEVKKGSDLVENSGIAPVIVTDPLLTSDDITAVDGDKGTITDPLFAALLNKPTVDESLRQRQGGDSLKQAAVNINLAANVTVADEDALQVAATITDTTTVGSGIATASIGEDSFTSLLQPQLSDESGSQVSAVPQHIATASSHHQAQPVLTLKDGSFLPESKVVQQTIDHLNIHARGDSSSVTVKLHPKELGELQLRMVMDGDQLKVHLHAQSQQVQEVLERHFPRLRDALQEQGVVVEDFQVSVDSGNANGQQFSDQREFVAHQGAEALRFADGEQDLVAETLPLIAATGGDRGLSVMA